MENDDFFAENKEVAADCFITPIFPGERCFIPLARNEINENKNTSVRDVAAKNDEDGLRYSFSPGDSDAFIGNDFKETITETFDELLKHNNECIDASSLETVWTLPNIAFVSELVEYMFFKCSKEPNVCGVPEVRYLSVEIFNRAVRVRYDKLDEGERALDSVGTFSTVTTIATMLHSINISAKFLVGEKCYAMSDLTKILKNDFDLETDVESMIGLEKQILINLDFDVHKPTLFNYVMTTLSLIDIQVSSRRFRYLVILVLDFVYLNHRQIFSKFYNANDLNYSETLGLFQVEKNGVLLGASVVFTGIVVCNGDAASSVVMDSLTQLTTLTNMDEALIACLASVILESLLV